jgi:erythronate-4-phosphate dehydrogenase
MRRGYHANMLILIDEDIPQGRETFAPFGEVRTFAGRALTAAKVVDADALIVRSVTRVGAGLLTGSRVRFVGTVTSGTDHVDAAWLAANGVAFASAAGCNSAAVAEYVLAAVLLLAQRLDFDPTRLTLGVVGVGRIGSRVARWGRLLGMNLLLCDPPLQRQTGASKIIPASHSRGRLCHMPRQIGGGAGVSPADRSPEFVSAAQLARDADIVTLHVPLTQEGADATADMVDADWLAGLKDGAMLINTSRGEVVREDHLSAALQSGRVRAAVLDVWRNEPHVDAALVQRAAVATPHVAGYSVEARQRAVLMIREALARFISPGEGEAPAEPTTSHGLQAVRSFDGADAAARREPRHPRTARPEGRGSSNGGVGPLCWWREAAAPVSHACDIAAMDAAFRGALAQQRGTAAFDEVRRRCAARREFSAFALPAPVVSPAARQFLRCIGFQG